jgi:putative membrane protein
MTLFLTLKALHLIAMVAWFAALFYLPRLFVYMREAPQAAPTLHLMARKLSHYIMAPAAVATWLFGMALALTEPSIFTMGWFHAKLGLILLLSAYTVSLEIFRTALAAGTTRRSSKFFRFYNEFPTLILIFTILLAVFKPF